MSDDISPREKLFENHQHAAEQQVLNWTQLDQCPRMLLAISPFGVPNIVTCPAFVSFLKDPTLYPLLLKLMRVGMLLGEGSVLPTETRQVAQLANERLQQFIDGVPFGDNTIVVNTEASQRPNPNNYKNLEVDFNDILGENASGSLSSQTQTTNPTSPRTQTQSQYPKSPSAQAKDNASASQEVNRAQTPTHPSAGVVEMPLESSASHDRYAFLARREKERLLLGQSPLHTDFVFPYPDSLRMRGRTILDDLREETRSLYYELFGRISSKTFVDDEWPATVEKKPWSKLSVASYRILLPHYRNLAIQRGVLVKDPSLSYGPGLHSSFAPAPEPSSIPKPTESTSDSRIDTQTNSTQEKVSDANTIPLSHETSTVLPVIPNHTPPPAQSNARMGPGVFPPTIPTAGPEPTFPASSAVGVLYPSPTALPATYPAPAQAPAQPLPSAHVQTPHEGTPSPPTAPGDYTSVSNSKREVPTMEGERLDKPAEKRLRISPPPAPNAV